MVLGYAPPVGSVVLGPDLRGRYVEIYPEDINRVCDIIEEFIKTKRAAA